MQQLMCNRAQINTGWKALINTIPNIHTKQSSLAHVGGHAYDEIETIV